jgi:DNA-directed RNA polymerase specialized sigma24 family protein
MPVSHGLDRLSERQRAVLVAKVFDDETFAEIAAGMEMSVSSAKTHYIRALRALRASLETFREVAQ